MSRLLARLGVVLTAAAALVAGAGSVAAAHVTVHADEAVQGGTAEIAFRVPTESDTASTVTVQVAFPADTPIAVVAVLPIAGWTTHVTTTKPRTPVQAGHGTEVSEVVSRIEWRAAGPDAAVKPGEYQGFRIVAGPLPRTDRLVFKVVQTYSDGQVQRWIDEPVARGSEEPEHPAPVLALSAAAQDGHGHDAIAAVAGVPVTSSPSATPASALWATVAIALVALIAALSAVVVSIRTARRGGGDESPA